MKALFIMHNKSSISDNESFHNKHTLILPGLNAED